MNASAPSTMWDRAPTDAELSSFYGENVKRAAAEESYRDQITAVFTGDIQKVASYRTLTVPLVSGKDDRIVHQPLIEAVNDELSYQANMELLMDVLQQSACPMVQALREQLAKTYADRWASDLAEYAQ